MTTPTASRADSNTMIHASAEIDEGAIVDRSARVWQNAHIRSGASIGASTVIGRGAYVGEGVAVGNNCKIQNYALVYEPAHLEDGVFVGPGAVLTNDTYPRAVTPDGDLKSPSAWQPVGVTIREGASIGARAVCVAPVVIGRWAMVAAGAVVTHDVPDFALMAGMPARQLGWVSKSGVRLREESSGLFVCPSTGEQYRLNPTGTMEPA